MKVLTTEHTEITERLAHETLLGLYSVLPVFSVVSSPRSQVAIGNAIIREAVLRKPWSTAKPTAVQRIVFGSRKPHSAMELPLQARSQVQLGNEAGTLVRLYGIQ